MTDDKRLSEFCTHAEAYKQYVDRKWRATSETAFNYYDVLKEKEWDAAVQLSFEAQPEIRAERDAARAVGDKEGEKQATYKALNNMEMRCLVF